MRRVILHWAFINNISHLKATFVFSFRIIRHFNPERHPKNFICFFHLPDITVQTNKNLHNHSWSWNINDTPFTTTLNSIFYQLNFSECLLNYRCLQCLKIKIDGQKLHRKLYSVKFNDKFLNIKKTFSDKTSWTMALKRWTQFIQRFLFSIHLMRCRLTSHSNLSF